MLRSCLMYQPISKLILLKFKIVTSCKHLGYLVGLDMSRDPWNLILTALAQPIYNQKAWNSGRLSLHSCLSNQDVDVLAPFSHIPLLLFITSQLSFDLSEYTANVDGVGTLRLLDAIRTCGLESQVKFYQVGVSLVYFSSHSKQYDGLFPYFDVPMGLKQPSRHTRIRFQLFPLTSQWPSF